jgi:hypothetical protein
MLATTGVNLSANEAESEIVSAEAMTRSTPSTSVVRRFFVSIFI